MFYQEPTYLDPIKRFNYLTAKKAIDFQPLNLFRIFRKPNIDAFIEQLNKEKAIVTEMLPSSALQYKYFRGITPLENAMDMIKPISDIESFKSIILDEYNQRNRTRKFVIVKIENSYQEIEWQLLNLDPCFNLMFKYSLFKSES